MVALADDKLNVLLSKIAGQDIDIADVTALELFMANLTNLLIGVADIDGEITTDEKQHLQLSLNRLSLLDGKIAQLTKLMIRGIRQQRIYRSLQNFQTLASPLNKHQRLLLIGLGYEMSAADGSVAVKELAYLQRIAQALEIEASHIQVFEACLAGRGDPSPKTVQEVAYLLDPVRFHDLDVVFTEAANTLLKFLPISSEFTLSNAPTKVSFKSKSSVKNYTELEKFKQAHSQLNQIYENIYQTAEQCLKKEAISESVLTNLDEAWKRLQSQKFRIAVVGEFSQGKSTFLNALLGEKIQPARVTPCSGTITVLRYGDRQRVVCRYKNGQEEEIPVEQYQEKAALSEDVAHGYEEAAAALSDNLIEEIIFEHPGLDLCKNGVEIVDSPGLNEHADRTQITQNLLKGTDVVLFLASAQKLFPEKERKFLSDELRKEMRIAKHEAKETVYRTENEPADNLFVLVNFMDMMEEESERQSVIKRSNQILLAGNSPILAGEDRIHYISAKFTLKAVLQGKENEYTHSFRRFVQALERFLTTERGNIELRNSAISLVDIIDHRLIPELERTRGVQTNEIQISDLATQSISEGIDQAKKQIRGIKTTTSRLIRIVQGESDQSLRQWSRQTKNRVQSQRVSWSYGNSRDRDAIARHFAALYQSTIADELDAWTQQTLSPLLQQSLSELDEDIAAAFQALELRLRNIDGQTGSNLSRRSSRSNASIQADLPEFSELGKASENWQDKIYGVAAIGQVGAVLVGLGTVLTGGILPSAVAAIGVGSKILGGLFGKDLETIQAEVREQILQQGNEQFFNSNSTIQTKIDQRIQEIFNDRKELVQKQIGEAIDSAKLMLDQYEKTNSTPQAEKQEFIHWIDQTLESLTQQRQATQGFIGDGSSAAHIAESRTEEEIAPSMQVTNTADSQVGRNSTEETENSLDEQQKTVVPCPQCSQKLRVPTNRGHLHLTCPKCDFNWDW
ncbi:MAG: dynamin family protein [Elainellaceae cyanobacterium]